MVLYGYLTGSPAPVTWCGQSWRNAAGQLRRTCIIFRRILCTTHKFNKRQVCKYKNVKPEICTRTDTTHNSFIHNLYYRIVWTPPHVRRPAVHLTTKRQILYFQTHTTDQFKRRAGDTLHCTSDCSQMHSFTHINLPHYALHKPNHLPSYVAIWLHQTQDGCRQLFSGCVLLGTTF
jgi:hypothetical protein